MTKTLTLTRRPQPDQDDLAVLYLACPGKGSIQVVSGAPGRQNFRTRANAQRGRLEPIPEGEYELGPLEWAGGVGNYDKWWSGALGPVWVTIDPDREIGFHLDGNAADGAPGTAGCVGFRSMRGLQAFVEWFRDDPPRRLVVDWGLGTIGKQEAVGGRWSKVFLSQGRTSAYDGGVRVEELELRILREATGALHVWRNGQEIPARSLAAQVLE